MKNSIPKIAVPANAKAGPNPMRIKISRIAKIIHVMLWILCLCSVPVKAQVPVSLMPIPRQQFLSASGTPLAGGFVYTYVAGTSTPAPTYFDYTGTNLNTNPITLDSGGFGSIWIPSSPVDVAVFNSSGTQQYKVLSVTALPTVVSNLTANYFQSSSTNPALSGFIRMASADQVCWRNPGNSADECLSTTGSLSNNLFWNGTLQVAFLNIPQNWTALQNFSAFSWTSGTAFPSSLTNANTAARNYFFPDVTGNVCISSSCSLINPIFNGVTVSGAPTGAGQTLVSTSTTAASWGLGAITDYESYGAALISIPTPTTYTFQTLPIGSVQSGNAKGSFIQGELIVNHFTYTGSAPVLNLSLNGITIGSVTIATSTTYDINFSISLSSNSLPQTNVNIVSSSPAISSSTYTFGPIPQIDGTAPVVLAATITTATAVTGNYGFGHVRVRY